MRLFSLTTLFIIIVAILAIVKSAPDKTTTENPKNTKLSKGKHGQNEDKKATTTPTTTKKRKNKGDNDRSNEDKNKRKNNKKVTDTTAKMYRTSTTENQGTSKVSQVTISK